MRRMGIPQPPFTLENQLYKKIKAQVKKTAKKILADFEEEVKKAGMQVKAGALTTDGKEELENLIAFFDEMGRQEMAREKFINEMQMYSVSDNLRARWEQEAEENDELDEDEQNGLITALNGFFKKDQATVLNSLQKDAPAEHNVRVDFSLDKQKIFEKNMEGLRNLYIDNSIKRIKGEQNLIKKAFLKRLVAYASGETETLEIEDVMKEIVKIGDGLARMFARDQIARFNKALTITQFKAAGVTKVKWVTSHDIRVRDTHKKLDGQIFYIESLPEELNDYNCRCGLVPVEYAE